MSLFFNRIYFQGTVTSGGVKNLAFVKRDDNTWSIVDQVSIGLLPKSTS